MQRSRGNAITSEFEHIITTVAGSFSLSVHDEAFACGNHGVRQHRLGIVSPLQYKHPYDNKNEEQQHSDDDQR